MTACIFCMFVDIDSPCEQSDHGTPLHITATNLGVNSAKVLLQNGADPHATDDLGRTPCGKDTSFQL